MYDRVLVTTDGSQGAAAAVEYGLGLAEAFDSAVDALYVVDVDVGVVESGGDDEVQALFESDERSGRHALAEIVERVPDLGVHREVRRGAPYEEILAYATERGSDLLVVGNSGMADRRVGSTAERVITLAPEPVLAVPRGETSPDDAAGVNIEDVVVPVDGSEPAERSAEHAIDLAGRLGATVHVVYVIDTSVYELADAPRSIVGLLKEGGENTVTEFVEAAEDAEVPTTWRVSRGRPAEEILARADAVEADLVVMGTRGRGGLPEHLLGSTTRRVVRDASRPVLSLA